MDSLLYDCSNVFLVWYSCPFPYKKERDSCARLTYLMCVSAIENVCGSCSIAPTHLRYNALLAHHWSVNMYILFSTKRLVVLVQVSIMINCCICPLCGLCVDHLSKTVSCKVAQSSPWVQFTSPVCKIYYASVLTFHNFKTDWPLWLFTQCYA